MTKIRCPNCNTDYYLVGEGLKFCHKCKKATLVPKETTTILQLKIRPGGYNDQMLCLAGGIGTKSKSGAVYLRSVVTVIAGKYKGVNFTLPIGLYSENGNFWQNRGRELIQGILNSSQGLSPQDNSREAMFARIIDSYNILDGIVFVGVVGIRKNQNGKEENNILRVLTDQDEEYQELVINKNFVPARKILRKTEPSSAMWRRV